MNAQTTTTVTIEALADVSDRKLTADDIFSSALRTALHAFAEVEVRNYTGDFSYMINLQQSLKWGLSDAQVAGALNTLIGQYRYQQRRNAAPAPVAASTTPTNTQVVADGTYTIVGPKGGHRTLRLQTMEDSTKQWLSYLSGSDNEGDYKSVGVVDGNAVNLFRKYIGQYQDILAAARFLVRNVDKLDEYGRQYAIRSGKCYRCNRTLTTPESVARGLGPHCATQV